MAEIELLRLLSLHVRREFTALMHYAANESPDETGMTDPEFIARRCAEYDVALLNIPRSTPRNASA